MDKQNIKNNLVAVLNTLDEIGVEKKKNVTKMAAIMNHLDGMIAQLDEDIKAEEAQRKTGEDEMRYAMATTPTNRASTDAGTKA